MKAARWAVMTALLLASACHADRSPVPKASPDGLEAAAIEAGIIPDPVNSDITGLYARASDRLCIVPSASGYRIGVFVDYDERENCGGSGTVTRDGETLHVAFGGAAEDGADTCRFDARFDGDRIVFPPMVPSGCSKMCLSRASIAALDVPRLSESVSEASTLRDGRGRLLCGGGG